MWMQKHSNTNYTHQQNIKSNNIHIHYSDMSISQFTKVGRKDNKNSSEMEDIATANAPKRPNMIPAREHNELWC